LALVPLLAWVSDSKRPAAKRGLASIDSSDCDLDVEETLLALDLSEFDPSQRPVSIQQGGGIRVPRPSEVMTPETSSVKSIPEPRHRPGAKSARSARIQEEVISPSVRRDPRAEPEESARVSVLPVKRISDLPPPSVIDAKKILAVGDSPRVSRIAPRQADRGSLRRGPAQEIVPLVQKKIDSLLGERRVQEAAWMFREKGHEPTATHLEDSLERVMSALTEADITRKADGSRDVTHSRGDPNGDHKTDTWFFTFRNGIRAVFKPSEDYYPAGSPVRGLVNHRAEIGFSRGDRLMGANSTPVTVEWVHRGVVGSLQYMVRNAAPVEAEAPARVRRANYVLGDIDAHEENRLRITDMEDFQVSIDHSLGFFEGYGDGFFVETGFKQFVGQKLEEIYGREVLLNDPEAAAHTALYYTFLCSVPAERWFDYPEMVGYFGEQRLRNWQTYVLDDVVREMFPSAADLDELEALTPQLIRQELEAVVGKPRTDWVIRRRHQLLHRAHRLKLHQAGAPQGTR
jgi:hypothetical protein